MGESYYSDGRHDKADLDPVTRRQGAAYLSLLRKDPPGQSTANRLGQASHFNGVVSIAIKARMDLMGSCSFQVLKKRKSSKGKSTFGPRGTVAKSIGSTQNQGRDEDYVPVDDLDFPLARMMSRPNPNETQGELAAKLVLQNCLTGVGPMWAVPNATGRPVELWSLKTPLIYPLWQNSHQYPNGAWRVQPYSPGGWAGSMPMGLGATGAIIPGEEVKRFLEPHPLIDWDGYSPLTAGAVELDVLRSIDESRKSAMDNGLQLDAVLVAPGMDEGGLQRFVDNMTERHGGSKNARKFGAIAPPAGLTDKATLQTFGSSAKDMDYSQGWEQYVKFALALFGVPASVAGLATTTSYSELYAALRQFHHRSGQYIGRFEAWYTKVLAWPWCSFTDEYLVRIKLPSLEDPDATPENVHKRQLQYDTITLNESRAKDDLDPVEGGDVPVSIYNETLKAKLAPKPEPGPSVPVSPGEQTGTTGTPTGGPLAGAVPTPENAAAEGTGLPVVKKANDAATTLVGSDGGFLVPDGGDAKRAIRRIVRRASRKALKRVLKSELPASQISPVIAVRKGIEQRDNTANSVTAALRDGFAGLVFPAPIVNVTTPPRTVTKETTVRYGSDGKISGTTQRETEE